MVVCAQRGQPLAVVIRDAVTQVIGKGRKPTANQRAVRGAPKRDGAWSRLPTAERVKAIQEHGAVDTARIYDTSVAVVQRFAKLAGDISSASKQ